MAPDTGDRWLRTRPSDLVAETLSDETLVIDTASGVFFSLRGVASALWAMLEGSAREAELRDAVTSRFPDTATVDIDVVAFIAALQADDLVVDVESAVARSGAASAAGQWPDAYEPPTVKKYDDMADLLLVDPIHDVDAQVGWPEKRSDTS